MTGSDPGPCKANLLFLESLPTISGGQAVLVSFVPALDQDYGLLALLPGPGPLADALRQHGVVCQFAPMGGYTLIRKTAGDVVRYATELPRLTLHTWRLIRQHHIALVYANVGRTFVWGTLAAALARTPIIWHHHNLLADGKTLFVLKAMGRWPTVRRIVAVSKAVAAQFPVLQDKVAVIPTGIDTTVFCPDPVARARIRSELGIPLDASVVGIVGDLIPLKGQQTFLEAVQLGPADVYYLIVGRARPGDDESRDYGLRLRALSHPWTIFTGYRPDIQAVLNSLDLLVIASERETGPLVLVEALACGVPVISTPVGRAEEFLPPDALFPVGDAATLAIRLRLWLEDGPKMAAARATARQLAEQHLSLAQFCREIRFEIERALPTRQASQKPAQLIG